MRKAAFFLFIALLVFLPMGTLNVSAQTSEISSCGITINDNNDKMDYIVTQDLTHDEGFACILVNFANFVSIDCQGHTITGTGDAMGINLVNSEQIEIKNCIIRNASFGIRLYGTDTSNIHDNHIYDSGVGINAQLSPPSHFNEFTSNIMQNNFQGMVVGGSGNVLSENIVTDSFTDGLFAAGTNTLQNNVLCFNGNATLGHVDIRKSGNSNGSGNTCGTYHDWNDDGISYGCSHKCGTDIDTLDITSSPPRMCTDSTAPLQITYQNNPAGPTYFFKTYGKYSSESQWEHLHSFSEITISGTHTFEPSFILPDPTPPAENDTIYTVRVVAQSCDLSNGPCWPTPTSFQKMDETQIDVLRILSLNMTGLRTGNGRSGVNPSNGTPETKENVKLTAALTNDNNVVVTWIGEPIGSRKKMSAASGNRNQPKEPSGLAGNPLTYKPSRDTHGQKRITAKATWKLQDGSTCKDEKTKDTSLFFVKDKKDYLSDCDGYPGRGWCDNWFRYWSTSDDSASNTYDRTSTSRPVYKYMGGGYSQPRYARYIPNPDFNTYYIEVTNRVSRSCAFNFQLPLTGTPVVQFSNKGQGIDCVEDSIKHEITHRDVDANNAPGGIWNGLVDTDSDELPDFVEQGGQLLCGYNLSQLGFNASRRTTFPRSTGFPFGDDEEVAAELCGFGQTGTHTNDWANQGKQTDPSYKREIVENGTDATLLGTYSERTIDTDNDGLFDLLAIDVGVNVVSPGTYSLTGRLNTNSPTFLTDDTFVFLESGIQNLTLHFEGIDLRKSRTDGPYTLNDVVLFTSESEDDMDPEDENYTTLNYSYLDFEQPPVEFKDSFLETTTDTNGNTLFDLLTIEVSVEVIESGNYTVTGFLEGTNAIASSEQTTFLSAGNHTIPLSFDGTTIRSKRQDGTYRLALLEIINESAEIDLLYDSFNTSSYVHTEFEKPPVEFTGTFTDFGADANNDSLFETLTIEAEVDVDSAGDYSFSAHLWDFNDTEITLEQTGLSLTEGVQTITLSLNGQEIEHHGVDGPYQLAALTATDENGTIIDHIPTVINTSTYDSDIFESFASITGNILSDNTPVSSVEISASGQIIDSTVSNADGSYSLEFLLPGEYELFVYPNPQQNLYWHTLNVTLLPGEQHELDISLLPVGSIAGTVTDETGLPVNDTFIYEDILYPPIFATNQTGDYAIPFLSEGQHTILIGSGEWNVIIDGQPAGNGTSATVNVSLGETTYVLFTKQLVTNTAPILAPVGDHTVNENELLTIDLEAKDPENDTLVFGLDESLPSAFTFDTQTGLFEWTPTLDDAGQYNVTFNVSDGMLSDSETITITVHDTISNETNETLYNNLMAYFDMSGSVENLTDLTGNDISHFNGVITGNPVIDITNDALIGNEALDFVGKSAGNDDNSFLNISQWWNPGDTISVSAWFQLDNFNTDDVYPTMKFWKDGFSDPFNDLYAPYFHHIQDGIRFKQNATSAGINVLIPDDGVTWISVILTYNSTIDETKIYVNGTLQGALTDPTNWNPADNGLHFIWNANGPQGSNNILGLDEIGIWNKILTADEVSSLYNEGNGLAFDDFGEIVCAGDINTDGIVDVIDLLALLANWNGSGTGDLNDDGTVDVQDLLLLLGNWGVCDAAAAQAPIPDETLELLKDTLSREDYRNVLKTVTVQSLMMTIS